MLVPEPDLGHHGDAELAAGLVDLAVNVRWAAMPAWLAEPIAASLGDLARYPDPAPARRAIAARHRRDPEEVLLTAGAAQGFVLLARALAATRTRSVTGAAAVTGVAAVTRVLAVRRPVVVHPQFTEPEAALAAAGHQVRRVLLPAPFGLDPGLVPDDADLVMVGNPTNPTSVLHPAAAIEKLARPGRILVVDEAFADTVPGEPESLASRTDIPGLVVVRSLTKTWGLAGLRIGYLLAAPPLIARCAEVAPLWPVSSPALAAAIACASEVALAEECRIAEALADDRAYLVDRLRSLPPVTVAAPPTSSFLLVRLPHAAAVRHRLRERGYAVRRGDTFPGLGPDWLRIAVRDRATTDAFVAVLGDVLDETEDSAAGSAPEWNEAGHAAD
ncbi:MAG: Rv2231c family pyridoxal phosphate-dependent protein CobC [Micromonosporaceae bacterium]